MSNGGPNHWRLDSVDDLVRHAKSLLRVLRLELRRSKRGNNPPDVKIANSMWYGMSLIHKFMEANDTMRLVLELQEEIVKLRAQVDRQKRETVRVR